MNLSVLDDVFEYHKNLRIYISLESKTPYINDEDIEDFKTLINIAKPYHSNNAINDIIYEEIEAYLAGQKTAEEVAAIMDNRVQLYLNEKYHKKQTSL